MAKTTTRIVGGDKLGPYLEGMAERLSTAKTVDVGFLAGATYPDGTSVPMVAALNEFGSSRAPPRPFFRTMIGEKQAEWGPATADLLRANDYDTARTLDQLGSAVAGQLKNSIAGFDGAPLAASTVKRKGFEKQLIDTSVMIGSVDHRVNGGDE